MVPFLTVGMVVINKKRWTICDRISKDIVVAKCGKFAQALDLEDLPDMYISVNDIRAIRGFKGHAYITKYHDHRVTNPHADDLPTHLQLKAKVDNPPQVLKYLPMPESFIKHLKADMTVLMSGGTLCGKTRTITSTSAYCDMFTSHSTGIEVETGFVYSKEWFAAHVYLSTTDIATFPGGKEYVSKFKDFTVTDLAKKGPTYEQLELKTLMSFAYADLELRVLAHEAEELKKKAHSFDRTSEPTKWMATVKNVSGYLLSADTEPGLKAKIALEFAKDPDLVFEVYAKVGEAKAQTLTQKILRFFNK